MGLFRTKGKENIYIKDIDQNEINNYEKIRSEMNLIYQLLAETIAFSKKQIWQTIYYVLLADAAIIGFYKLADLRSDIRWILIIISALISLMGLGFVCNYNYRIMKDRNSIDFNIKPYLSDIAKSSLGNKKTVSWNCFDWILFIVSFLIFSLGFLLVCLSTK